MSQRKVSPNGSQLIQSVLDHWRSNQTVCLKNCEFNSVKLDVNENHRKSKHKKTTKIHFSFRLPPKKRLFNTQNKKSHAVDRDSLYIYFFLALATECEKSKKKSLRRCERYFLQSSSENRQVKFGNIETLLMIRSLL